METVKTQLDDLMPLFREQLSTGGSVRFSPKGTSMLPMLRPGIDSVVISPVPEKLKRYDLSLYCRPDGRYVLHRIVRVDEGYTCMGDNQFVEEKNVHHDQMIGLVTAFYRGQRCYSVTNVWYRLYCIFWYRSRYVRRFGHRLWSWFRRYINY